MELDNAAINTFRKRRAERQRAFERAEKDVLSAFLDAQTLDASAELVFEATCLALGMGLPQSYEKSGFVKFRNWSAEGGDAAALAAEEYLVARLGRGASWVEDGILWCEYASA
jgi:hypothetical protein